MEIEIMQCRLDDLPDLQSLAIKTFVDTYSRYNTVEVMSDYLESAFSDDQLEKELRSPLSTFYGLCSSDRWIGYLKLNMGEAQTDVRSGKVLEIERIYVDRDFQGRGFGKLLLEKAILHARRLKMEVIWLGVWEHNPKAIRFYESQGFVKNGVHPFVIGGEIQTDWVMELKLTGRPAVYSND